MDLFKKSFFLFLITVIAVVSKAQQSHFIYLQTDNGEPFYVKLNHKIISSSAEGFVILPGLADTTYQVKVGFPKNEHPEETFDLKIEDSNEGFVIKNFEDKGIQLFNLETLALIAGTNNQSNDTLAIASAEKKEPDPFTQMLANVVKDSSILENHQVVTDKPLKPTDSTSVANADTNLVGKKIDSSAAVSDSSIVAGRVKADTTSTGQGKAISKILSRENEQGLTMLYADSNGNLKDTVNVFIPGQNASSTADSAKTDIGKTEIVKSKKEEISSPTGDAGFTITPTIIKKDDQSNTGFVLRKDSIAANNNVNTAPEQVFVIGPEKGKKKAEGKRNAEAEKSDIKSETDTVEQKAASISEVQITDKSNENKEGDKNAKNESKIEVLPKVVTSSTVNSDCKAFASNEDFLRLRKKMAAESSDAAMIRTATKYFKSKCFSTSQIKDLSYLFLTNEGKYMFFDAAYAYTSDSDQYETLESQLNDAYYLNRFKAMIRK